MSTIKKETEMLDKIANMYYKTDGDMADEAKQQPLARDEFAGSDEEYEEHCEACAI